MPWNGVGIAVPHGPMVMLGDSVSALGPTRSHPRQTHVGHAAGPRPVRLTGGDRLTLSLAIRPRRQKMTNHQQQSFLAVSLGEVADPDTLWGLILEEVSRPEGADQPIQADDQV